MESSGAEGGRKMQSFIWPRGKNNGNYNGMKAGEPVAAAAAVDATVAVHNGRGWWKKLGRESVKQN